jgi:FAD/FMN-containing dehydrogenase
LGIVTAASLKLAPAIGSRSIAWIGLASPQDALALLRRLDEAMGDAIEGFELVPQAALELVLRHVAGTRSPLERPHAWHVLVEAIAPIGGSDPADRLGATLRDALEAGLIEDAALSSSEAQAEAFWRIRDSVSEAEKADGPAAKHDLSVEVSEMPAFMVGATVQVESRFPGTRVVAFGHLGDGNVHFNVRAPQGAPADWPDTDGAAVTAFVHDLVTAAGGSISAEHGIGQMRLAELARLGDPAQIGAMQAIKQALDPRGIMNPGKLVPSATLAERPLDP